MMVKNSLENVTWIDLDRPDTQEVRSLIQEHFIPADFGDELISPSLRPHTALNHDTFFISLHIPTITSEGGKIHVDNKEVDFVIKENSLVTARYTPINVFENFSKFFETEAILKKHSHFSGIRLFQEVMIYVYRSLFDHLDQSRDALRSSEQGVFESKEKEMVVELSRTHQQLLRYQESLRYHDDILHELLEYYTELQQEEDVALIELVQDEYERVMHSLDVNMGYLHELRDTNNSLLSIKQNNTMQLLTIMAYVSLPASIIASIFGMNARNMPIIGLQNDFWILISFMAIMSIGLFIFFKYKKWL